MAKYLGVIDKIFFIHCTNINRRYRILRYMMNRLNMNEYSEIRYTSLFPAYKDLKYFDELIKTHRRKEETPEEYIIGVMGCLIEQYKTIKQAYNRGFERIMICEDDFKILPENELNFIKALQNLPEDANIIKVDTIMFTNLPDIVSENHDDLIQINEYYFKYVQLKQNYFGTMCLIYDRKGMEFMINMLNEFLVEYDTYFTNRLINIENKIDKAIVNNEINVYHMNNTYLFKTYDNGNITYNYEQ